MLINAFAASGLLIAITCAVMAMVMLAMARNPLNLTWGIFCLAVLFWGVGAYFIGISPSGFEAVLWWRIAYIGVIFIPVLFLHFVLAFLNIRSPVPIGFLYVGTIGFLLADLFSHAFISGTQLMFGELYYMVPSPLYNTFLAWFTIAVLYSHALIWNQIQATSGGRRQQIIFFFLGSFIGFLGGGFSFLPVYNISIYPYPNIAVALFPIIMGYAIIRHRLFDIRVVLAESLTIILWIILGFRFIISIGEHDALINGITLAIVLGLGTYLIRSIMRDVSQREQLQKLTGDLQTANEKLTELDKLKSQFLSFASHQLRTPLTTIKWHAQLLLEGTGGEIPEKAKETIHKMEHSANQLVELVNEFLNLRKLEEGKMEYAFEAVDLNQLVGEMVESLQQIAIHKNLKLTFTRLASPILCSLDRQKFTQVIQNLIDNSLKYTDTGSVSVKLELVHNKNVRILVTDTGHGIDPAIIDKLFEQFMRAKNDAVKIEGTGLGLYIAKQIVEAHHGKIWATSPGLKKGSTFIIELPTV
jgi:signal transduction histidine kinase